MSETARMDWQFSPHTSPQSAQETSDEIPSDAINTPASTTRDSHDATVQASLPQTPPPSSAPFGGLLSQRVLELISLHQITCDHRHHPIDPASYITELETLGEEHFARRLVVQIENFFQLPQRYELALEDRIQDAKQRCDFLQCPQHERPNGCPLDTRDWICEAERYETTKIDYPAWPEKHVQSYALVCLSQLFGRLHYTPPTDLCPDAIPSAAALLISLHEERRKQYGIGSFTPIISLKLRTPGPLKDLIHYHQLQKEGEFLAIWEDWQYVQHYGDSSYIQKPSEHYTQGPNENPRVKDLELRAYEELASMFQGYPVTGRTVSQLVEDLQGFGKAWTDFMNWSEEHMADLTWLYIVRLLAILGFKASMKDVLKDPRRVLTNIYCLLQWESPEQDHEWPLETPLSSLYGGGAEQVPLLCSDTENLPDGEEDDTALNSNAHTDDHIDADDCYRLLEAFNDDSRHLVLRLFGLWVMIQEREVEEGRIKRSGESSLQSWRTFANLVLGSGLNGAICTIESQISPGHLSKGARRGPARHCEEQLGMQSFSRLQSPNTRMPLAEAVELLSNIPRYKIKDGEVFNVFRDYMAVGVYLAACVAKLGYVFPADGLYRGHEIANKVWYKVRG